MAEDYSDVDQLMGNNGNFKKTRHNRAQKRNFSDSNEEDSTDSEDGKRRNKGKDLTLSLPDPPKFKDTANKNTLKTKTSISVEEPQNIFKKSCAEHNIINPETAESVGSSNENAGY